MLAEPPVADATAVWSRLKGVHALSFPAACAALELVRWRERAAQRSDRPRRWLLDDDSLLALAAALPRSPRSCGSSCRRSSRTAMARTSSRPSRGATTADVQAIVRAHSAPQADRKTLKALQEEVRRRADVLGIEPEILATRRELAALAAGNPPAHLKNGWRAAQLAGIDAPFLAAAR